MLTSAGRYCGLSSASIGVRGPRVRRTNRRARARGGNRGDRRVGAADRGVAPRVRPAFARPPSGRQTRPAGRRFVCWRLWQRRWHRSDIGTCTSRSRRRNTPGRRVHEHAAAHRRTSDSLLGLWSPSLAPLNSSAQKPSAGFRGCLRLVSTSGRRGRHHHVRGHRLRPPRSPVRAAREHPGRLSSRPGNGRERARE